jgi:hypothetical protein
MLLHWTYTADHGDDLRKVNLAELDKLVGGFSKHPHTSHSMYSASLTMADNRFMARVCHFVFGTLLLMLTKPDFVTRATLRNRVPGKAQQAPKEFWTPNVLGLHYRIRRLAVPLGGTHASPKGHWVRGAYKEQPYGEKLALRKRRWIAPYWRGGEF